MPVQTPNARCCAVLTQTRRHKISAVVLSLPLTSAKQVQIVDGKMTSWKTLVPLLTVAFFSLSYVCIFDFAAFRTYRSWKPFEKKVVEAETMIKAEHVDTAFLYDEWLPRPIGLTPDEARPYASGGSTGNMVWQFAMSWLLPPDVTKTVVWAGDDMAKSMISRESCTHVGLGDCRHRLRNYGSPGKHILYLAMGPFLLNNTGAKPWMIGFNELLKGYNQSTMIGFGLGVNQAHHTSYTDLPRADKLHELKKPTKLEEAVSSFILGDVSREFLNELEHHSKGYGVRGDFTAAVVSKAGFNRAVSVGCPSLFLNTRPNLGTVLGEKYKGLLAKVSSSRIKIAFNIHQSNRMPQMDTLVLKLIAKLPGSFVVVQEPHLTNKFISRAQKLGIDLPDDTFHYYTDVHQWYDDVRSVDLVIGTKIHGNMIALAAETPALLLPPDWRVKELADAMNLAATSLTHGPLTTSSSLEDIVKLAQASFDPQGFDKNRRVKACIFADLFAKANAPLRPDIANLCKELTAVGLA